MMTQGTRQRLTGLYRLLMLAHLLDTADEKRRAAGEPTYNQRFQFHPCGTPACAWGLWVAHRGLEFSNVSLPTLEFCATQEETHELFSSHGCNNAKTSKDAANYLRLFVEREARVL